MCRSMVGLNLNTRAVSLNCVKVREKRGVGGGGGSFDITKLFLIYSANGTSKRARCPLVNFKLCKMADGFPEIVSSI